MSRFPVLFAFILSASGLVAQTDPSPQTLPYSQNFGTVPFSVLPAGIAAWGGLNGGTINTQALAAASVPTADAAFGASNSGGATSGSFGLATGGNARFYIQTSSSAPNGANQAALAINTTGQASVTLGYDVECIVANTRTIGVICQYRVGNTGPWTTLSAISGQNPYSQSGGTTGVKTSPQIPLPAAALNQSNVQIRWAVWRGTETGSSSGIAIDNIVVTGSPAGNVLGITISPTSIAENDGATALVTVTTTSPVTADLPVTLTINDPSELALDSPNPAIIPTGASSITFTVRAVDDDLADGDQAVTLLANAPSSTPATASLTVLDDEDAFSPPAGYYSAADGLTGAALKAALHTIISTGHIQFSYSSTFNPLRDLHEDPANPANLLTVYSGTSLGKFDNFFTGADGDTTWSREHVWPVSYGLDPEGVDPGFTGADAGPDYTDLFNLRPILNSVNTTRGNLYYDNSSGTITIPTLAPLCTRDPDSWEPRDVEKGDLARIALYMMTRYDGSDPLTIDLEAAETPNSTTGRFARRSTLLAWHLEDPVSQEERKLNQRIFTNYQQNRNPFIDHPDYASLIWGGTIQAGKSTASVTEGGAGDSYTLVLTTQPAADVTINLSTSPSSQVITAPGSLTFTPSNWNQAQTVTLSAVDDAVHEPTLVTSVAHSVSSADSNYASLTPDPVNVTVTDNDPANPPTSLPIAYGGPWNPLPTGFAGTGLGSPYTTSLGGDTGTGSAKFDDSGDSLVISFNQSPSNLSYHLKGNPSNGTATEGTFLVLQSPDGGNYSTLHTVTNKNNTDQSYTHPLSATTRFVKFIYQQKTGGNIQFDKLSITGSPWLAWQSSYGLSGIDTAATSDFDRDGFMNLAEYALGGSPVSANTSISPVLTRLPGLIRITAIIRLNDPALESTAETTTDVNLPASWTSAGVRKLASVSQSGVAPGFERMVFEVDDGGSPRRFIRLRFILDEPAQ